MKLEEYERSVDVCEDIRSEQKSSFFEKYKDNLNSLKNHQRLSGVENVLLPAMYGALPFVNSAISFSNRAFSKFLSIEQSFSEDVLLVRDLESEFSNNLAKNLDGAVDTLYNNFRLFLPQIKEHIEIVGNLVEHYQALNSFEDNISNKKVTCKDVEWFNKFNFVGDTMRMTQKDYIFHVDESYRQAKDLFSSDINMYGFDNRVLKKIS